MPSFVNSLKTAIIMAPLLASCGGAVNSSPYVIDPNGLILPDCTDGQLIGVNPDKTLFCVPAPSGMLTSPVCQDGYALTSTKDAVSGKNVTSCIAKGSGANDVTTSTRITNAKNSVTDLQNNVNLLTTGGGARAKYVGASTMSTNSTIASGAFKSVAGANKLCEASGFGTGSHMCTPFEIYESVIIGNSLFDGTADIGPFLIYMESWVPPFDLNGASEPNAGISENCGAMTYNTADRKWRSTTVTLKVPPTGGTIRVPHFNANTPCGTSLKLACCK